MADLNWQTTEEKEDDFSPIPAGEYIAHINESELKDTRSGNKMLALRWEVLDGPYKGRLVFENLNLYHKTNEQARKIAEKAMNSICYACGFPNGVQKSEQLHNKAIMIKVAVKTDKEYGDQNTIKKHEPYGKQPAQQEAQPQAPQQEAAPPWKQ